MFQVQQNNQELRQLLMQQVLCGRSLASLQATYRNIDKNMNIYIDGLDENEDSSLEDRWRLVQKNTWEVTWTQNIN